MQRSFRQKKESKRDETDNYLILNLDCEGALFETKITEIRFYSYKIKTDDFDMKLLDGGWWLSDEIIKKGNHYLLDIKFDTAKCKTRHLVISFHHAEVIKKQ